MQRSPALFGRMAPDQAVLKTLFAMIPAAGRHQLRVVDQAERPIGLTAGK
jgi:hypothetical protein